MQKKNIVNQDVEEYEKFVNILIHDLRAPISHMIEFAELISDEETSEAEKFQYAQIISKEGHKTLSAMQSYLNLQKIEKGTMVLAKKPKSISEIVAGIENIVSNFKNFRGRVFINNLVTKNDVGIDENLFYSMITNLVKNAVEAIGSSKSDIFINIFEEENLFRLTISNEGVVPVKIRSKLFKKFSTASKTDGTGLGLFSVKLIAKAHGGNVVYQPLSGKTSFSLKIPFN
ncbi:MAG: HAMP domain-containing sensor histidine kinase [Candidatus Nomurabacteria bacterium]|nr:HAMP domain-containing sensor histidine kinase [Candidatus Nomurabacteria bacterium]